jgi:PadR family transcriptional regulator PadR
MLDHKNNLRHQKHECSCPGFKIHRFIQPCLLILLHENPSHGYELMERLSEYGFKGENPDPAMVYRNLRKMEEDGLVTSQWETTGTGPAKRLYSLTRQGEESIHSWAVHIKKQVKRLACFLEKYDNIFMSQ